MTRSIGQQDLNLVKSIAGYYARFGAPMDDLVQEGLIGLLEASDRYDPDRGAKFSTYASFWIKKRILHYLEYERSHSNRSVEFNDNIDYTLPTDPVPVLDTPKTKISLPEDMPTDEQDVLRAIYEDNKTLGEMSKTLGLRREKVRQIKQKALRRLRNHYLKEI